MSSSLLVVVIVLLLVALVALFVKFLQFRQKYSKIVDIDEEVAKAQNEVRREVDRFETAAARHKKELERLTADYSSAKTLYDRLRHEVSILEETLEDMSFGLYKPHYTFEDPASFKVEMDRIYKEKKLLVKENTALSCPEGWTVNGNAREGAKMVKQESKLMLRAFNGEVDAAVAKVSWNNVQKMEERIRKTYDAVNELGSVMRISINKKYLDLSLAELRLAYELEQKKQEIKEEQREIREQMRQEEIAQREFEKAKKAAEADEARYLKALEAAREEMAKANAAQMEAIAAKVQTLEGRLAEAQNNVARAISMAQLTKSGHVYVISNVGSFGDDVFKIGMSRRLEPAERVYELGSASVPFPYDIHAMIYSDNAPALETAFHKQFAHRRVNMVNMRKEFFRVDVSELEAFVQSNHADIEFTKLAEAREYRETLSLLAKVEGADTAAMAKEVSEFPDSLPILT